MSNTTYVPTKREALIDLIDSEQLLAVQAWRKLRREIEVLEEQLHEAQQDLKALPDAQHLSELSYAEVAAIAEDLAARGLIEVDDALLMDDATDDGSALVEVTL